MSLLRARDLLLRVNARIAGVLVNRANSIPPITTILTVVSKAELENHTMAPIKRRSLLPGRVAAKPAAGLRTWRWLALRRHSRPYR